MTDIELREEFIRIEKTQGGIQILVREIRWEGPHTPISTWAIARTLPATASESEIENIVACVVGDRGYFRACLECGEKKPIGWMHNERICQGCAEANHGIVH